MAMTLAELITEHEITMTAVPTDSNPHMDSGQEMDHWRVELWRNRPVISLVTTFSTGIGHRTKRKFPHWPRTSHSGRTYCGGSDCGALWPCNGAAAAPPTASDVLDCLASDASEYDGTRDFEDWASDYGYDTDSRKAEATDRVIAEQAKALRHFMGDAYDALIEAERL